MTKCGYPKLDRTPCENVATCTGFCRPHSRKKFFENLQDWQKDHIKNLPAPPPKKAAPLQGVSQKAANSVVVAAEVAPPDIQKLREYLTYVRDTVARSRSYINIANKLAKEVKDQRLATVNTDSYESVSSFLEEALQLATFLENQTVLFKNQVNELIFGQSPHNVIHLERKKPDLTKLDLPDTSKCINSLDELNQESENEELVSDEA